MRLIAVFAGLALAGCASSSTIPLSQDTFQITASAAPICGMTGAQRYAIRQAAVETIRRGYDRFIIVGGQAGQNVVGAMPTTIIQDPRGGLTTIYDGTPLIRHSQGLVVKVFRDGDPAGANALSARTELGPNWAELAANKNLTCLD